MKLFFFILLVVVIPSATAIDDISSTENVTIINDIRAILNDHLNSPNPIVIQDKASILSDAEPTPTATTTSSSSSGGVSSGGGGSGGGGATSSESFSNIASIGKVELYWSAGKQVNHAYKNLDISNIIITPSKNAGYVEVRVEELKQKSDLTKTEPSVSGGKIYKYYNIWLGTTGLASVKVAEIKFKAPLVEGKVTKAMLMRYDGKKWITLDTVLINADSEFAYYSAQASSFSPFAIVYGLPFGDGGVVDGVVSQATTAVPTIPPKAQDTPQAVGFEAIGAIIAVLLVCARRA